MAINTTLYSNFHTPNCITKSTLLTTHAKRITKRASKLSHEMHNCYSPLVLFGPLFLLAFSNKTEFNSHWRLHLNMPPPQIWRRWEPLNCTLQTNVLWNLGTLIDISFNKQTRFAMFENLENVCFKRSIKAPIREGCLCVCVCGTHKWESDILNVWRTHRHNSNGVTKEHVPSSRRSLERYS